MKIILYILSNEKNENNENISKCLLIGYLNHHENSFKKQIWKFKYISKLKYIAYAFNILTNLYQNA